jgi:carboxypeptidase C (cathepsin A)
MKMHYVFIESERSPSTDPLIVWCEALCHLQQRCQLTRVPYFRYNGGPGASSLFGLYVELGPLLLNDLSLADPLYNSTGIPQLVRNPWGWSSIANLLVVDNPPPVGFSFCEPAGVKGDGYSCGNWTDDLVALANAEALRDFGALFPTSFAGGVYLIGESYAGARVDRSVMCALAS